MGGHQEQNVICSGRFGTALCQNYWVMAIIWWMADNLNTARAKLRTPCSSMAYGYKLGLPNWFDELQTFANDSLQPADCRQLAVKSHLGLKYANLQLGIVKMATSNLKFVNLALASCNLETHLGTCNFQGDIGHVSGKRGQEDEQLQQFSRWYT